MYCGFPQNRLYLRTKIEIYYYFDEALHWHYAYPGAFFWGEQLTFYVGNEYRKTQI